MVYVWYIYHYLPTKLCHFWGFYVGKYSSTIEHLGVLPGPNMDDFPGFIERGRGFSQGRLYRAAKDGDIEGAVEAMAIG